MTIVRRLVICLNYFERLFQPMSPSLFTELMAHFYNLGWMKGTGGAMGVIVGKNQFFVSPSALQKERLKE